MPKQLKSGKSGILSSRKSVSSPNGIWMVFSNWQIKLSFSTYANHFKNRELSVSLLVMNRHISMYAVPMGSVSFGLNLLLWQATEV
jgi:hypothetical protein